MKEVILTSYSEETAGTCECGKKIGKDGYCETCDYEGRVFKEIGTFLLMVSIAPFLIACFSMPR